MKSMTILRTIRYRILRRWRALGFRPFGFA